jgi:hypothetical protein
LKRSPSYTRRNFLGTGIAAAAGLAADRGKGESSSSWLETRAGDAPRVVGHSAIGKSSPVRKPLRPFGIFMANHNGDTGLRWWEANRWKREIADHKRMGANSMWYLPFEFGQRARRSSVWNPPTGNTLPSWRPTTAPDARPGTGRGRSKRRVRTKTVLCDAGKEGRALRVLCASTLYTQRTQSRSVISV